MTGRVVKYSSPTLVLAVVVTLAVAGCNSSIGGSGSATTGSSAATTTNAATSPASTAADPLANTDPCSLLDPAIVSENGLGPGQNKTGPGTRYCTWNKSADASSPGYLVSVDIYDNAGLDQLNTTDFTVTNYTVGNRVGRLSKSITGGTCAVSIPVTSTSRVDVNGVDDAGRLEQACAVSETVAPAVAQKLPSGNG